MGSPHISVVIPTYKRPKKLKRAIESVRNQTYRQWELVIVNDAPECDINSSLPDDDRITLIQHNKNKGAPAARNTGIQVSKNQYLAFLDDDDTWKPKKLEKQINEFSTLSDEYGFIFTGCDIMSDDSVIKTNRPRESGDLFENLLFRNIIPSPTPLIKQECFQQVGKFDTKLSSSQDYDMWLRIAKEFKFSSIPESLAQIYRDDPDRISDDMEKKYRGKRDLIEKYHFDLKSHPKALSRHLKQLGLYSIYSNRQNKARKCFLSAFLHDVTNIIALGYGFVTLLPYPIRDEIFSYRKSYVESN